MGHIRMNNQSFILGTQDVDLYGASRRNYASSGGEEEQRKEEGYV
jgi:hypothetical protein